MNKILGNRLLLVVLAIPAVCWGPGLLIPGNLVSMFASFLIFLFGAMSLAQRWRVTVDVLWHGRRDEENSSSHFGIVGDLLIMVGLMYSGVYGYWYVWADQPDGWSGTMYSSFGRILIGAGLFFNFWMVHRDGTRRVSEEVRAWIPLGMVAAFVAGCLFMSQMDIERAFLPVRADRPACPSDRPIWGTAKNRYHTAQSLYRAQVVPVKCFATEDEAREAGFRKID